MSGQYRQSFDDTSNSPEMEILGGTNQTKIGNVLDRLKVDVQLSEANPSSSNYDAFGRARVSELNTLFELTFPYDVAPLRTASITASGGTVTHDANKQAAILTATTTTNSTATHQSRATMKYHPGKSSLLLLCANLKSAATNVKKRIGLFDDNNGMFFELNGSTLNVVVRSKVSGSVVDTAVPQSSWNIDKLDGTGDSGYTLDLSMQQLFIIDFQWLGTGKIRFGFYVEGQIRYCHTVYNANNIATIYNQFGFYPIRAQIINTGSTSSTMEFSSMSYSSEGGWSPTGLFSTINNGITSRSLGTAGSVVPLLSLRKQSAYHNVPVRIVDVGVFAASADDFIVSIVFNGTLTGASWANVDGYCQKDAAATAISGGNIVYSSYLRGASSSSSASLIDAFSQAANFILGSDGVSTSDIISIVATNITASASASAYINYRELV